MLLKALLLIWFSITGSDGIGHHFGNERQTSCRPDA
jgi:hypothetical protein